MEKWMALVLLYGTLKGIRDVIKKKALDKSSVIEVLFFYTLILYREKWDLEFFNAAYDTDLPIKNQMP